MKMVAAILTTPVQLNDRQGATTSSSSDDNDDDVEPREGSDPALKPVEYGNSDYDSLSSTSESSLDASFTTRSRTLSGKAQDSSSEDYVDAQDTTQDASASGFHTIQNPIFEGLQGKFESSVNGRELDHKRMANSAEQQGDVVGNDDRNITDGVDERSRLMAAALAASIPSDDSFSDDSTEHGPPHARSISTTPEISRDMATRIVTTFATAQQSSEDLESDESSSFSSVETDSEISTSDDESQVRKKVQDRIGTINSQLSDLQFSTKSSIHNLAEATEDNPDDGSSGSERSSDLSELSGNEGKKLKKKEVNSASFSAISNSFKWSHVKSKIFYSFRALQTTVGSSSEGSRTISVRNLATEVTDDHLYDFFEDSGRILDIWIVRDAQSEFRSAYVEFDSGNAARRAVRKSGRKLEGRVILCDIAYENSRASHSVPGSNRGVKPDRFKLFKSNSASITNRMLENQSALNIFHPQLQEGDAKFLSRFSEQSILGSRGDIQPPAGYPDWRSPFGLTTGRHLEGKKGLDMTPKLPDSYQDSNYISGKSKAEQGKNYSDALNLEEQQSSTVRRKLFWASARRKRKFMTRFSWPGWRIWPRWQGWQFANHFSRRVQRKTRTANRPKATDTKQKRSEESVKLWC